MDSPKFIKNDSANLLLNEIDILLAQTRLLELYVKQSQATAAYETARAREEHQTEIKRPSTRPALGDNEQQSSAHQTAVGVAEQRRRDAALQSALTEKQRLLQSRDIELQNAKSETADLRDRIAELETARQQAQTVEQEFAIHRQDLQVEVAALRRQLETRQQDVEKQQLISRAMQEGLEQQLAQLQDQLIEEQSKLQGVATELQQARIEIAALREENAEHQTSLHEAQAIAAHELEQARVRLEAEIAGLQLSLGERDRALEDSRTTIAKVERSLETDILTLRSQLGQKQQLIEFRDDELRNAHGQLAALQQRIIELESAQQATAANAEKIERSRRAFESDLTNLQREAAIREQALTQRQEALAASELALQSEIQNLLQEQARSQSIIAARETELNSSRAEVATLSERIGQLEAAAVADLTTRQLGEETRRGLETDLTSLQATLAQKEHALEEQQSFFQSVEDRLGSELSQLRSKLAQQGTAADASNAELERLHSEITALQEQSAQTELARRQLEEARQHAQHVEAQHQELEARLQVKDGELRAAEANAEQQKEAALREQERQFRSAEEQLGAEINQVRGELAQQRTANESSNAELERLRVGIAALQEQSAQSELSRRDLEENWQHAVALTHDLEARLKAKDAELRHVEANAQEQKEIAVRKQEILARAVEERLAEEINQLRIQLEEYRQQAEAQRQELEGRLQVKEHELRAAEANTQQQKEAALREQERQFRSVEEQLAAEINQLRGELVQHRTVSEFGNAELEGLRSEIAELQERNAQAELAHRRLEEGRQHVEAQRRELETRLQAKEHELCAADANAQEQKEAALREQEILFKAVEERLAAEINQLRIQLEEQYGLSGHGNAELARLRSEIAEFQERNEQSERSRREFEENWQRAVASEQESRASLRAKEDELHAVHTQGDEIKTRFETAISQLQLQLTEKGLLAESRVTEIENLQADIHRLSEQLTQRESAEREAKANSQKEIESSRAAHQAEMAAVHEEHHGKQQRLENELAQERQNTASLRSQNTEREWLFEEAQAALKKREQDFAAAAAEAATFRARLHEVETASQAEKSAARTEAEQALTRLETELISIRSDLQQKNWAVAQQQAAMENLALVHKSQIQNLEAKLAEQQHGIQDRNLNLEKAQSQNRALLRRIEELETELQHVQLAALSRAEQTTQEHAARIDDLNSQLAQKTGALQERELAATGIERTLRSELDRLIREAEERNQILQNRNDELVRVKAETDALQERFMQLESSTSQAQRALAGKTESMQTEFQARLALLQAELSQKEWALEERDAIARGAEQTHHEELESLRRQVAEKDAAHTPDGFNYVLGEPRLSQAGEERFQVADSARSNDRHSYQTAQNRRWHTGFSWKRRWKS